MDYNNLLTGKTVFISTAAAGMGKDIALLFAQQGATVVIGGRDQQLLNKTVAEIQSISPKSKGYLCDLSIREETENACSQALKDFGTIDILVNTVGVNVRGLSHEYEEETLEKLLETNYKSGLRCAKKFIPGMLKKKKGNIINISSIHSVMTMPTNLIYAGTKGAMNASARAMALDYAKEGIRVNTICPGLIMSDAIISEIQGYKEGKERDEFMNLLKNMQPLEIGTMRDVSNLALFLASDMSNYITGQTIMLDGGASIKAH